ncbi:MAG TPA: helix-turn-helix transcriptional regulator [Candidatus Acidoferrum sp.]
MTHVKSPLQNILQAVPGKTVAEQAKLCGVSRQSFHAWKSGKYRPKPKQAWRLANITGYSLDEILNVGPAASSAAPCGPRSAQSR